MKTKPLQNLTFGIAELSDAFGCDTRLLKRRLNDSGHGALTSWTIRQCHDALAGDGSLESLRAARRNLTISQDELAKLDLEERRERLIDVDDFARAYEIVAARQVAVIESSSLSDCAKDELRASLSQACNQAAAQAKATGV